MVIEKIPSSEAEKPDFEIIRGQFPYKKLYMLQKALQTVRFTSLSEVNWVENDILKSKIGNLVFVLRP